MNIQLLLSANQGQSALSSAPAQVLGPKGTPQALFQQALTQASGAQLQRLTSSPADVTTPEPLTRFAELLASLDIELNEETLADLLAQLQAADSDTLASIALEGSLGEGETPVLTPLDEIAARLSLVDAFSGTAATTPGLEAAATQVQDIAQQLAISERQATELLATFNALRAAAPEGTTLADIHRQVASLLPSAVMTENNPSLTRALPVNGPQPSINLMSDFDSQQLAAFSRSALAPPVDVNASPLRVGSEMSSIALAELAQGASRGGEPSFFSPSGTLTPATGLMSSASIATPVSSPAWPSQLGQQLMQFAQRGGEHEVKMQLHPAELGPLSISLKVSEHGTQAHFLSAHAQVRQVLEQAIPQLREALAEQGISLGETSVGEHNNPNEQAFAQQGTDTSSSVGGSGSQEEGDGVLSPSENNNPLALDGRVDLYA